MEERNDNAFADLGQLVAKMTKLEPIQGVKINWNVADSYDIVLNGIAFDPYERIKELENENERLKNMLKECEI